MATTAIAATTTTARSKARQLPNSLLLVPSTRVLPVGHAARRQTFIHAVGLGCTQFLGAYSVLHLAHAEGVDWRIVRAISPIPLFSIFIASLAIAAVGSVPAALAFGRAKRWKPSLPVLLVSSIGLFAVVATLFP
jgi:hypothetical protein